MLFYKIIDNDNFIGVATSYNFCKYIERENINPLMLICDLEEAQYILCNDVFYHDSWMRPETKRGLYATASVIEIPEDEYNKLIESIDAGEDIQVEDEQPQQEIEEDVIIINPNDLATIEFIKSNKISEMSNYCSVIITEGFDVLLSDGESHHFSLTTQDQLNLITLSTLIASGETTIPYHADGELCKFYSVEDMLSVINAATSFKTYHTSYFNSLKSYIESLDDINDVLAITYGTDIPKEFQSDVLQALLVEIASGVS